MEFNDYRNIHNEHPKNIYRFHVTAEMGDADGDVYNWQDFPDTPEGIKELEKYVRLFMLVINMTEYRENSSIDRVLEDPENDHGIEYPTDVYCGLVDNDPMSDYQFYNSLNSIRVTRFNEYGQENEVKFNPNDDDEFVYEVRCY